MGLWACANFCVFPLMSPPEISAREDSISDYREKKNPLERRVQNNHFAARCKRAEAGIMWSVLPPHGIAWAGLAIFQTWHPFAWYSSISFISKVPLAGQKKKKNKVSDNLYCLYDMCQSGPTPTREFTFPLVKSNFVRGLLPAFPLSVGCKPCSKDPKQRKEY